MKNDSCSLIRESFDCSTYERDRTVFSGRKTGEKDGAILYAFRVEDRVMRMSLSFEDGRCRILQVYPDSSSELLLDPRGRGYYALTLSSGHRLVLIAETTFMKHDDFETVFKYNLYEEHSEKVISFNEVTIKGD